MANENKRMKLDEVPGHVPEGGEDQPENENENGPKGILSLNDDCFDAIFEKLSLDDFSQLSQTCKRIYGLCGNYFKRRYKEKVLIIDGVSGNGTPNYGPKDEKYVVAFAKIIQNVTFGKKCTVKTTLPRLITYYAKKEVASIKQLRFDNWQLQKSYMHLLAKLVKEVESVTFLNMKIFGDLNECALKFMEKMKELTLSQTFIEPGDGSTTWMQQKYPKLERFTWHVTNEYQPKQKLVTGYPQLYFTVIPKHQFSIAKLKQFFTINPNIQFFSLLTRSSDVINQLNVENIRVNELFFECTYMSDLSKSFEMLLTLCEVQSCRLHLKFDTQLKLKTEDFDRLMKLAPYIEGLYSHGIIDDTLAKRLISFEHLKVLQCDIFGSVEFLANFPNLVEIHVTYSCFYVDPFDYESTMITYASRAVNLKKIYLGSRHLHLERLPLQKMDMERLKLNATHKLKIYVPSQKMDIMTAVGELKRNYNTVEVIRSETEVVKNPFANK